MSSLQYAERGPVLPLIFLLTASLLYILFDLSVSHPALTPLGIYNMYTSCDNSSALIGPAAATDAALPEVSDNNDSDDSVSSHATNATDAEEVKDVTDDDLRFIVKGDYKAKLSKSSSYSHSSSQNTRVRVE